MPSASSQKQIPLRHCVVSSPSHSKVQSTSMYSDEPIFQIAHHQQPQSLPPLQVATSLWPQQTSNYWFPNWRELFHGFIVGPSSQPIHATVSSFTQNQAVACTPYSPSSCTQYLHLGTDDPTQFAHHGARSAQHQQITSSLPSSSAHNPLSRFHDVTRSPRPSGKDSQTAAQSPTPVDQTQKRDEHVASCPPSSQALGPITKYTIKSPFWLPQGWVTEMRMRSTGTAADKFFKHLASGRRFRSRNEVLHFIHTGKGRTRKKQGRRKKSLNFSLMNNFAHKKHTAFVASKLVSSQSLPSSSSENRHPLHVGNLLLTEPRADRDPHGGESGPSSKQHICFSANIGIQEPENLQLQLKRSAQDETQKLPVKKKQKILPLKAGDDKQTSDDHWQWFKRPDTDQAKVSEMAEQRNENDLSSRDTASQKTEQLGRDIQAAHKTMVQISKEMQATVEKLSREIREAQKDVESGSDLKLPGVPAEMQVASIYQADAGKICRDTPATPRECMMLGSVVQASHWLPITTNNQTGQPESAVGFVSHNVKKQDNIKGFPKQDDPRFNVQPQATNFVLNAMTAERSFVNDSMNQPIQPAIWPDMASHQVTHMDYGSHAAKRYVETSNQATQPAETTLVTTVNGTQAVRLHVAAPMHVTRATVGNVTLPALWPGFSALNVAQTTQIANIAHVKAAEKCGSVESRLPQCAETTHFEASNRAETPQRHVDMGRHHAAKQPVQVDSVGMANGAQAVRTQMAAALPPTTERPVYSISNADAPLYNPAVANTLCNVVPQQAGDGRSEQWQVAQVGGSCEMGTTEEVWRQKYQDIKERSIRRNKFAAVLNPKLDLSRLNPALTTRQKAKVVQRMKTRHARQLLATLGLHLCRKALRQNPWITCTRRDES